MNYDNEIEKLATALADEAMDKSATYNTAIDMVSDLTIYEDLIVIAEGMIKERAFASVIDHTANVALETLLYGVPHSSVTTGINKDSIASVELPGFHDISGDTI